jgi:hypothetical protein
MYIKDLRFMYFFYSSAMYVQYIQSFFQSRLGTADYALQVNISLDNQLTDGGEVISNMRRSPFTRRKIPGSISVRG